MKQLSLISPDAGRMKQPQHERNETGPWRPPSRAEEKAIAWAEQLIAEEGWPPEVAMARARSCYGLKARRPTPYGGAGREFQRRVLNEIANSRMNEGGE